jgi:DNA repair photolyase
MLQDLDLIQSFGDGLRVGVSITTDDDAVRQKFEPHAPSIRRRLQLIEKLHGAGIKVYASLAPLLPCNPNRFARLLGQMVDSVWVGEMNYQEINTRPHLLKEYASFFEAANYRNTIDTILGAFDDSTVRQSRGWRKQMKGQLPSLAQKRIDRQASDIYAEQDSHQLKLLP